MATVQFFWDDAVLRAAADTAYGIALVEAAAMARGLARWQHVAASIRPTSTGFAVGPGAKLEEGGSPPHVIDPAGGGPSPILSRGKGSGFAVGGPVQHPGFQGSPFMGPTEDAWPGLYVEAAKRTFPKR